MEQTKIKTIGISRTDKKTGRVTVKQYATVDSRVEFFRSKYPAWAIHTEFINLDITKGTCVCRATIIDENNRVVATGTAYEWTSKPGSMVNGTSYIENAETSAVGRALGFLGIGINGMGIASAEEVTSAIAHHDANDPAPTDELVGDSVPFAEPVTPHVAGPDDWMPINAFAGECSRINDLTALQTLVNEQRDNPNIRELIPIATARKQEILNTLQAQGE
ncbi:MAG: hypothetical protein IKD78_12730 [Bacteroidales bacterium]|nr:hypothetical protein [Bacteroidales bacterium]